LRNSSETNGTILNTSEPLHFSPMLEVQAREDTFLDNKNSYRSIWFIQYFVLVVFYKLLVDIPLPVRPFGSQTAYASVEEALKAFVAPETFDFNNQYRCEKCNKKCDAHKGLKFSRQLMRMLFGSRMVALIRMWHRTCGKTGNIRLL